MNKLKHFMPLLVALVFGISAFAQTMNCPLSITVTAKNGESLAGLTFTLTQTDYELVYPGTTLDADGSFSMKVYAGNHNLRIEKKGLLTYSKDFEVTPTGVTLNIELEEAVRTPFALKSEIKHDSFSGQNDITLSWNKEEPAFFDDFESHKDWAINFAPWTGFDNDQLAAAPLLGDYPNRAGMQYAQIFNPLTVVPTWWYTYEVLLPYSGKQYVGFTRTNSGDANDDWLITPTIKVGNENILSFQAKAGDKWPEKFEVYITESETPTVDDFVMISAGNYETVSYEAWEEKVYDLSAYAGKNVKIAIRYIGCAKQGGAFLLMIDDFYVGQQSYESPAAAKRVVKRSPSNPTESFEVYLDNVKVADTENFSYVFENVAEGDHTLGVKAVYTTTSTEIVSIPVTVSNEGYAALTLNVTANNGLQQDGLNIELTDKADGERLIATVADGKVLLNSLAKGEYILKINEELYEQYVQDINLIEDASIDIELKEIIFAPSNIAIESSEAENGLFNLAVSWNKDLGFFDGFEEYEDFATGEFGQWRTYDVDKQPVYPIALGSIDNIVSFPGSGTQESPTAIAPMVFNPYMTNPEMAPYDEPIMAPEGVKALIFFSSMQAKSDKWAVSPIQTIRDNYVWKVTAKAYAAYPEIIEFCISESGELGTFSVLDKVQLSEKQWTEYTLDLSEYKDKKVYLGIHYVSTDAFIAEVDEFYVGPASETAANVGNVKEYEVYLDDELKGKPTETVFDLTGVEAGSHTLGVRSVYESGKSDIVTYTFQLTAGIDELEANDVEVRAELGKIVICADSVDATVTNIAGQQVAVVSGSGKVEVNVVAGVYLVSVNGKVYKVSVR